MLSNVNNYYLVIYSDETSSLCLQKYLQNPRIRLVITPVEEFYTYRYKDQWIKNHEKNALLRERVDWKVNMLWAEKVHFVYETMCQNYFNTDFYGWCDIGYFRGNPTDLDKTTLSNWPNPDRVSVLNRDKIYYACVQKNDEYIRELSALVLRKNENKLPIVPIPPNQVSIAGGFFVTHKHNLAWWRNEFDSKLALYFKHDYLVKDDQLIIVDCVFSNMSHFTLCKEHNVWFDNWFMFQRLLL